MASSTAARAARRSTSATSTTAPAVSSSQQQQRVVKRKQSAATAAKKTSKDSDDRSNDDSPPAVAVAVAVAEETKKRVRRAVSNKLTRSNGAKKEVSEDDDESSDHDEPASSATEEKKISTKKRKQVTSTSSSSKKKIGVGAPGWGSSAIAPVYLPPAVHESRTAASRDMPRWTRAIVTSFADVADDHKHNASGKDGYMRHQFQHLGFKSPTLRDIMKTIVSDTKAMTNEKELITEMRALWALHEREYQHAALELALRHSKLWSVAMLPVFAELIQAKSWWDTVDTIAPMVGALLNKHVTLRPEMDVWVRHTDKWMRRVAIIHQLKYKKQTDSKLLFRYCTLLRLEEDFFIRKAIGWALREYSKTDKVAVRAYITSTPDLSGLSVKEGGKYC